MKVKTKEKPRNFDSVMSIDEIQELKRVRSVIRNLQDITQPEKKLSQFLNNLVSIADYDTDVLEEYLAIFTVWQNYLGNQSVIADVIYSVAESQKEYFYSTAVGRAPGTINMKKDLARSDVDYALAADVYQEAQFLRATLNVQFANCDRGYRLISRILTKRLGIREFN